MRNCFRKAFSAPLDFIIFPAKEELRFRAEIRYIPGKLEYHFSTFRINKQIKKKTLATLHTHTLIDAMFISEIADTV